MNQAKELTSWYRVTDEVTLKDGTTVKEYRTVFETTDHALSEESVAWCMAIMDRGIKKRKTTEDEKELLTADERADVLNTINEMLDEFGFDLVVAGYDDSNGVTFKVILQRKEE